MMRQKNIKIPTLLTLLGLLVVFVFTVRLFVPQPPETGRLPPATNDQPQPASSDAQPTPLAGDLGVPVDF